MENLLKTQFIQLTLILSEFERDFREKLENSPEINMQAMYMTLGDIVLSSRKIMGDYCLEEYDNLKEVFDDELDLLYRINKINNYLRNHDRGNKFYPYVNSMFDIIKDTMNTMSKKV